MTNDDILKKWHFYRLIEGRTGVLDYLFGGGYLSDIGRRLFDFHPHIYEYPKISLDKQNQARKFYNLNENEVIYYVAYRDVRFECKKLKYVYFVISTHYICFSTNDGRHLRVRWEDIDIVWSGRIQLVDGNTFWIPLATIAHYDDDHDISNSFIENLNELVEVIKENSDEQKMQYLQTIRDIKSIEQMQSVYKQYEKILSNLPNEEIKELYLEAIIKRCFDFYETEKNTSGHNSSTSKELGEYAMNMCETYLQRYSEGAHIAEIYFLKGMLLGEKSDVYDKYESLRCIRASMNHTEKSKIDHRLRNELKNKALSFADSFLSMPSKKRQFLVIDNSLSYLESNVMIVLPQELPEEIHFPIGHPQEHVLYIKHPFIDDYYIPYETSEFELFKDKMDELRRVLQTMGATHITISDIKSLENSKNRKSHTNIDTNINAKINSLKGNADSSRDESSYESLLNEYGTESTYMPTKKPYIPDGLVWYPNESSWQRLFEERKDGLAHYKLTISSKSSTSLTRMQEQKLKTDFKTLILHIDASLEHEATETFEQNASATWELEIDFAPLEQLINDSGNEEKPSETTIPENTFSNNNCETADEAAYLEEVRFCLEDDGQIDEKERRMLERIRIKYNIDKSRAEELEKNLIQGTAKIGSGEQLSRVSGRQKLTKKANALLENVANQLEKHIKKQKSKNK